VRAGREFLNLKHSRWPRVKLYSIVAARNWRSLRTLTLRRNWPLLTKTLADAGITSLCAVPDPPPLPHPLPRQDLEKYSVQPSVLDSLPQILLRGMDLPGNGRKTRSSRLRKVVKQGAKPLEVVKAYQKPSASEAVDPALGDELVARLSRRLR
jgi:hypothetical protein